MGTETTQKLLKVTAEGPRGPAYLRFSGDPVQYIDNLSGPAPENESVVIDVSADGKVVGVELVFINPETIAALGEVAQRLDLDLSPLFWHSEQGRELAA